MRKLVAAALLLSLSACSEQVEETYPTWAEAERAGAIKRGWVPAFVPPTARDIRDIHDLDTNGQTLQFTAPTSDVSAMLTGLQPVSAKDKSAASELSRKLGFDGTSEAYIVCSEVLNGALVVDRTTGRAAYKTSVHWADDDCPRAK
jgi:hypothetical protein